ncbi:MAG: YwaF family protein [Oscillospiraceae bacterium]|nr:YwaF family protein [Oscillospiraceae bacterium]
MELWTKEHAISVLPALAVMILLCWVFRVTIGKKSFEIRMIPFKIVAILVVLLEIGKQALSFAQGYDLYHIPLHYCSLFIFMLPIMAFYRGKHQDKVGGITAAICSAVFIMMIIYPALIFGSWNVTNYFKGFFDFHTVTVHLLIMFAFLLIPSLNLHTPAKKGEQKAVIIFIICFCAVSATAAQLMEVNFNNFYQCNIPPLEAVRQAVAAVTAEWFSKIFYVLCVTVMDILFTTGAYWAYRGLRKLLCGKVATPV